MSDEYQVGRVQSTHASSLNDNSPRPGEALRWEVNFYIEQYRNYFNSTQMRERQESSGSDEVETSRKWYVHEVIMGEWRTLALLQKLCNEGR